MEIFESKEGAVTVVKPYGPMIAGELDGLENKLLLLIKNRQQRIVIDFSNVPFLDSAGLELLFGFQRQLRQHGLQLKLCGLTEMTQQIFDLTKLSRHFEIYADTAPAVRSYL